MEAAYEAAVDERAAKVVIVSGEAGLGKTRLLEAFLEDLASTEASAPICGYGQALSVGVATEAFGAVRECLRSIVDSRGDRSGHLKMVGEALKTSAPAWLEAIPVVGQLLSAGIQTGQVWSRGSSESVIDLASPVDQFVTFIDTLSQKSPLVLVLDDLHWADNATIELVMRLAMSNVGPLLLVLSYRVTPGATLTAAERSVRDARNNILRYRGDALTIDLEELPNEVLLEALSQRIELEERVIGPSDLRRIVELSGGNLLVAECLLMIHGGSDLTPIADGSGITRIGAIMDIGLSQLDPKESQFLEACATVGPIFDAADVAIALNVSIDDVFDQIDLLAMKATLIVDVPSARGAQRYRFHHPILAEVLRDRAMDQFNRWRRINDRLVASAELYGEERGWDAALLARMAGYAVEAERGAEAFRWALAASRKQLTLGSTSTALATARAAIEAAADAQERLQGRLVLIECLQAYADHDAVVSECDAAIQDLACTTQDDTKLTQANIVLQRLRGLRMLGEWTMFDAELPALIDLTSTLDKTMHEQALMLLAEAQLCGKVQDLAGCRQTLQHLQALDLDAATASRVVGHLGLVALAQHQPVEAEHRLQEAIALGEASSRPYDVYESVHWMSKKQIACLELDEAAHSIERLHVISERHGIAGDTPFHDRDLSRVLALLGQLDEAARLCVRYFDASGSRDDVVATTLALQIAELEALRGREAAGKFIGAVMRAVPGQMYDSDRRNLAGTLTRRLQVLDDLASVEADPKVLAVAPVDHASALAIFNFNVPDIADLRAKHA
jgi:hypothetical protein